MKKYIIICLFLLSCYSSKAFHYFGSEITCKQINGLTYHVTFKFYGELYGGWNWNNEINLSVANYSTGSFTNVTAIKVNDKHLYGGIYQMHYSALFTFPAPGEYVIYQGTCCWTHSSNIITSISQTYHNQCLIKVDTITGNSSPEFLYDPIVFAPVNDTLYYNPLPYDADGDILLWSIDTPRTNLTDELLNYNTPGSSAGMNFFINPKTGEVTWIPTSIGKYITSIKVEEYRNGIKIGEIVRDMIFIVEPKQGNLSRANIDTHTWSTDPFNNFIFYLTYNVPFNLVFTTHDADSNNLAVEAKGHPFFLINNPAVFTSTSGAGISTSMFSWTPTFADINIDPYLVVFRIYEDAINNIVLRDRTIRLTVGNFISVNENLSSNTMGNIYPNPSAGELFIPLLLDKDSDIKLIFINQLGQEVKSFDKKLNSGQNLLYFNKLNLPAGIYFINATIDGHQQVSKLIIE